MLVEVQGIVNIETLFIQATVSVLFELRIYTIIPRVQL